MRNFNRGYDAEVEMNFSIEYLVRHEAGRLPWGPGGRVSIFPILLASARSRDALRWTASMPAASR
jgi:hypothetical protein